ncbi:MAG TPA: heme ABC transporter ATP-binding protein [Flavitalea sp.]|nr:heme ABC transporter ATP-binding protein [Flavitalea sp.]
MLKTENITYTIGKKNIVNNVSAEFLPGELNMILGPNGSGKSTFLKIFCGELKGYQGTVLYNDENITKHRKEELAQYRAVMSQQPELTFPLLVEEVVMMGRYPHFSFNPAKKDETICNEVLERMDLLSFRERNYLTLSGGEKQRVQFARVLAQIWEKPAKGSRYLFLDEPLNNLDINYQQEFLQIAKQFTTGDTVLVAIMHDINLAIQYADKLFFLKEGSIVQCGRPKDIVKADVIREVFKVSATIINNPVTNDPLVLFN